MKTIKINESQKKRLFEAYSEGFSFKDLSTIGRGQFAGEDNTLAQYAYCKKYLGDAISNGSSRAVFQLNDNFVIKLAMGYDGFMQNEREYKLFLAANSELLVKIIYCSEDYSYIVSESVITAREEDFEKILGIAYSFTYHQKTKKVKDPNSINDGDIEIGFDRYFDNIKPYMKKADVSFCGITDYLSNRIDDKKYAEKCEKTIKSSPWLTKLRDLINDYKLDIDDLFIPNIGVVNRDGKPMLVILDSGLNDNDDNYEFENNY